MSSPSRAALIHNGQTITELPGLNKALGAGGTDSNGNATNVATIYDSSPASVTTDVLDYPPGTPVIITGRGFQPNELVDLTFHEDPHVNTENPHVFTVQADANGNFVFDQYSPELADVGVTYILGAKGELSGWTAQTTFKDALKITVSRDNPTAATLNLASGAAFSVQFKIENSNTAGNAGTNLDGNYTLTFSGGLSLQTGGPATSASFTGLSGTSPLILQWSFQAPTGPATGLTINLSANITSPACSPGGGNQCSDSATYTVNVAAPANTAPTVTANDQTFPEGTSTSYSASWSDPDASQSHTCTIDFGDGAGPQPATVPEAQPSTSGTCSASHTYADGPNAYTIAVSVSDGTATGSDTASATVNNVAPTATLANNGPVNEGSPATISFSDQSDPSPPTRRPGSTTRSAATTALWLRPPTPAAARAPRRPARSTTTAVTRSRPGSSTRTTGSPSTRRRDVNNVAPTATLANNGPVNEGSPATISFSAQFDPSSADTAAGFHYAFACANGAPVGATYAGSGTSASTTCTFNDNGIFTVTARIIDKDDGFTEYTTDVTVNNVAPTATLSNNGPVNEGSPATISFSNQFDPSSADTAAGFHYAFACDNGSLAAATYAGSGTSASTSCTYPDGPSTHTVRARIIDKDDGFTEYTTDVTVNNVAPTVNAAFAAVIVSCGAGNATLNVSFSDPGLDTHTATVDWGDGSSVESLGTVMSPFNASHTYASAGPYNAVVTVTDSDGDPGSDSTNAVTVNFTILGSGILPPIRQDGTSIFKSKSTIPVKIQAQDCNGSFPSNLAPQIRVYKTSGLAPSGDAIEVDSTSGADTGGVLRFTGAPDYQYIYNMAAKSLPDASASYLVEVTIPLTNQKIYANFGLKP